MIVYVLFFAVCDPTIVTPLDLFTSDDQKYHAWLSLEVIKICCVQLRYFLSVTCKCKTDYWLYSHFTK